MNTQVLVKAKVLDTPIDAVYQKKGKGSTMLVYGKAEIPTKVTLTEFVGKIANMIPGIEAKSITDALPEKIGEGISLSLKHVYFVKETDENGNDKEGSEYAFWVSVHLDKLTEGFPVEVESISLKIWSTDSKKILDEMKINEINELLLSAGIAPVSKAIGSGTGKVKKVASVVDTKSSSDDTKSVDEEKEG